MAALRRRIHLARHYGPFLPRQVFSEKLAGGGKAPELVVVPYGRFRMGGSDADARRQDQELPAHEVEFRRGFAIAVADDRHAHALPIAHAFDVGEDHERIGRDQIADERGELIVVAELDLLGRDRVVLVDDRHHRVIKQCAQREARRQEAPAVAEVVVRHEDLTDREALVASYLGEEPARSDV